MEIPLAIHKDENSVYGVIVPDLPGCFSWGESIEDAIKNACAAIGVHVEAMRGQGMPVDIRPSSIEDLSSLDDYAGAVWSSVKIDWLKLQTGQ
jgi:predicted RNase H-like HicB family nuclease